MLTYSLGQVLTTNWFVIGDNLEDYPHVLFK